MKINRFTSYEKSPTPRDVLEHNARRCREERMKIARRRAEAIGRTTAFIGMRQWDRSFRPLERVVDVDGTVYPLNSSEMPRSHLDGVWHAFGCIKDFAASVCRHAASLFCRMKSVLRECAEIATLLGAAYGVFAVFSHAGA